MVLKRYEKNPIIKPILEHPWESYMTFNCAAIELENKIHIVYRARGVAGGISRLGYAVTSDGFNIEERLEHPIYLPDPENDLEMFGCEDPRITRIGDTLYMCYTAFGMVPGLTKRRINSVQLAITTIKVKDFLNRKWNKWSKPIYPFPRVDNKDSFILSEKYKGKYVLYHRIPPHIWIAYSKDLKDWYNLRIIMQPKYDWEYAKLGGGAPSIKTNEGWLFIYHAVDRNYTYRLGAALIDLENPERVIKRAKVPLLSPETPEEKTGDVGNVTFTCGAVVKNDTLFVYYGAADTVINVATAKLSDVIDFVKKEGE